MEVINFTAKSVDFVVPVFLAEDKIPQTSTLFYSMNFSDDICSVCPDDFEEDFKLKFGRPGFDKGKLSSTYLTLKTEEGDCFFEVRIVNVHSEPGRIFLCKRFYLEVGLSERDKLVLTKKETLL